MKGYIITHKDTDTIVAMGEKLGVQKNGNWLLTSSNVAYPSLICCAYSADGPIAETADSKMLEGLRPIEVPDEVEPDKYCYTAENGFFENPNYEEPNNIKE